MDTQLRTSWPSLLKEIAQTLNPAHEEIFKDFLLDYWSAYLSEWATEHNVPKFGGVGAALSLPGVLCRGNVFEPRCTALSR